MSDIIVISNSSICKEDFLLRIEKLAKAKPKAIGLREKHLPENDYEDLAKKVIKSFQKDASYATRILNYIVVLHLSKNFESA